MGIIDDRWAAGISRRSALAGFGAFLVGSPLLQAQRDLRSLADHRRVPSLGEMATVFDFEPIFHANLPQAVFDYTAHGAESEFTVSRNRQAFDRVRIVPSSRQVTSVSTAKNLFGVTLAAPILVAPTAGQASVHPDGEVGMYMGAAGAETTMIVPSGASVPLERIAAAASGRLWYQYLPTEDVSARDEVLGRAQHAGYQAVVVTVDGRSLTNLFERDLHDRHLGASPGTATRRPRPMPWNPYRVSDTLTGPWVSWKHIEEIRPLVEGPLLVKGILTAEDALRAVECGVDGIVVSNHGGRVLDYDPSTLEVLPEIVQAVAGRITILVDSGFRRGSDVFKAIAIGADAVLLGRATRWGLGAFGPLGVQRLLEIVQAELAMVMKNAGYPTLDAVGRAAVSTSFA